MSWASSVGGMSAPGRPRSRGVPTPAARRSFGALGGFNSPTGFGSGSYERQGFSTARSAHATDDIWYDQTAETRNSQRDWYMDNDGPAAQTAQGGYQSSGRDGADYGATPQREYGATQQREYGATPQREYGATQQREYGATQQREYGATPQREYGATPQREYGATQQREYDATQQREYGATQQREYGATPQREYGATQQREYGAMEERDYGETQQRDYGSTQQREYGATQLRGYGATQQREYGATPQRGYGATPHREYGATPQREYGAMEERDYGASPQREYGAMQQREYGAMQERGFTSDYTLNSYGDYDSGASGSYADRSAGGLWDTPSYRGAGPQFSSPAASGFPQRRVGSGRFVGRGGPAPFRAPLIPSLSARGGGRMRPPMRGFSRGGAAFGARLPPPGVRGFSGGSRARGLRGVVRGQRRSGVSARGKTKPRSAEAEKKRRASRKERDLTLLQRPWMTEPLREAIQKLEGVRVPDKPAEGETVEPDEEHKEMIRDLRKQVRDLMREAKEVYVQKHIRPGKTMQDILTEAARMSSKKPAAAVNGSAPANQGASVS